ncbi:MAG: hypothetical protein AAF371_02055 [Pseudomonadota bacterium]
MQQANGTYRETGIASSLIAVALAVALALFGGVMVIAVSGPDVVVNGQASVALGVQPDLGGVQRNGGEAGVRLASEEYESRQSSSVEF